MNGLKELVGKKVTAIRMNEEYLVFETDGGDFAFTTEGDCCSHSYFYDFLGVQKLLKNGAIKEIEEIAVEDDGRRKPGNGSISCYGFRFITEDPQFGEVSSVMSFRNDSNGYYGGWLQKCDVPKEYIAGVSDHDREKDYIYV